MSNNFDIIEALWLRREKKRRAQKIIEGVPPLTYIAKNAGALKNYRIYGQTVDGESVGDRTGNLFDGEIEQGGLQGTDGTAVNSPRRVRSTGIQLSGGDYTISATGCDNIILLVYSTAADYIPRESKTSFQDLPFSFSLEDDRIVKFALKKIDDSFLTPLDISNVMLNVGSTPLPYEPYGYRVPVTVSNGTDTLTTPIYLPEQMRKVRDYSDYIDYGSQKFVHRVVRKVFDGTEQFAASEKSNVINYFVPVITMGDAGNSINCTSNHISVVSGNENWANRRVPNAQYVSSFFQNNASQIRFVWNDNNGVMNLAGFTSQLSTWYANGDPLIVDYIIVEPVEEQVTLPALPTIAGINTLSVGTQVQPSKVTVKGKISQE